MNVTFESAVKILCCGHSNESSLSVLSQNAISQKEIWKFGQNLLLLNLAVTA